MRAFSDKVRAALHIGGMKKDIVFLIISGLALFVSISLPKATLPLPFDIAWVAIILCGIPMMIEALIGVITEFNIKAGVLVSIALIASVCIGEYFAAGEVAFIMLLGTIIEDLTVAKAKSGIERLVNLTPRTARIISEDGERIVSADEVNVNDIVRVLPGEAIPVDGVIVSGETSVNQAVMTGEPLPVDKSAGDEVSSGTINQFGAFDMRAVKVGEDSSIQRMIRLVQSADAGKAKIVGIADKWATWVVVFALSAAILTWILTGQLIRAVTILVVFCPCALVLATPTAIMAAIGNVTERGFLVKDGGALERLARVKKLFFDKTGTLTCGKGSVTAVKSVSDMSENEIYAYTAAAEQFSEHPLGKAVARCFKSEYKQIPDASDFKMLTGRGVMAVTDNKSVIAGNERLMAENNIEITKDIKSEATEYISQGCTVIYTAIDNSLTGYIVLADVVRNESSRTVSELHNLGVSPVLLTGDNENIAKRIASKLGIADVKARCMPEDKLCAVSEEQKSGASVAMIGDGINDAPALKRADVGIAMGGIGSDIATQAADIVLANDEITELPHLIGIAKRMINTIKVNLTFSMTINLVSVILAFTGIMTPVVGALVHNAGSTLVTLNSALLLLWHRKS